MPVAGIRRSLAFSFLEKYSSTVVQFGTSLIVARLITPEAFGVFAIAYAIVGFAHVIREMGVNSYLVQLPELAPRQVRAGLFATGVVAWSLGFTLLLLCPLIEHLYGAEVRRATTVLLLIFFVMPVSSTIVAILHREMNFVVLLRINLAGTLANSIVAIVLAAHGYGYLGLAWASVAGQVVSILAAAWHRPRLEHFLPSARGAGQVFRFGSMVMLSSLLHQFSTNIASLITARFISVEAFGLLSRGQSVTGMVARLAMDGAQPLLLPVLASLRRNGQDVTPALWQSLGYLAVVIWPLFLFVALYAQPIVIVLFGEQWVAAVDLLRLMCIGGIFWIVQPLAVPLLTAFGKVKLTLHAQVINQAVAVLGVLLAAVHGVHAVAAAAIAISAIHALTWTLYLRAVVSYRLEDLRRCVTPALLATGIALLAPAIALSTFTGLAPGSELLLGLCCFGGGWIVGVAVTRHPIWSEILVAAQHLAGAIPWLPSRTYDRIRHANR
jgi:O-antigen/teichoic acid export membrane protein